MSDRRGGPAHVDDRHAGAAARSRAWLDSALDSAHFRRLGFESVHLDDLLAEDYSEDTAVAVGLRLLDELVAACGEATEDLMVMLTVVVDHVDGMDLDAPAATGWQQAWDHFTPPELYVQRRTPLLTPYVVEEYKKPYPRGTFPAPFGSYHAYYRCHRQDDPVEFCRGLYVEHYPR